MTFTTDASRALLDARWNLSPIPPLRETNPDLDVAGAYAIQLGTVDEIVAKTGPVVGYKIGLTSLAMQQQLGVDSPDFGFFTQGMFYEDGATIPTGDFISLKVEPEFAFKLNKDLPTAGVTADDVRDAVESVHAAIEIIDSRIANWDIKLVDTIADNASCGAVAVNLTPLNVTMDELTGISCGLVIDGTETGRGTGADVLGDPANAVAWLANALGEQGTKLSAGDWVLPGSFCAAAPIAAGGTAVADFGDLGSLTIHFS